MVSEASGGEKEILRASTSIAQYGSCVPLESPQDSRVLGPSLKLVLDLRKEDVESQV